MPDVAGWIKLLPAVRRHERAALSWSCAWFFLLMFGYNILRPVREAEGLSLGVANLKWLFLSTFLAMLVATPAYSSLATWLGRRRLATAVHRFFSLTLVGFWLLFQSGDPQAWAGWLFYVWVSVFNLFSVSLFWSFQVDAFNSEQGKRLYGYIAAGATLGAIAGSAAVSWLPSTVPVLHLLLIPALLLELVLRCARRLDRAAETMTEHSPQTRPSMHDAPRPASERLNPWLLPWTGALRVFQSGYLTTIFAYTVLMALAGTAVYFQQMNLIAEEVTQRPQRVALFATMNFYTQALTLPVQAIAFGWLVRYVGLAAILCILPAIYALSFVLLFGQPLEGAALIQTVVAIDVARRVATYGLNVPAKEVLFTVIDPLDKYRAKGFLDTVAVRGGDALAAQSFDLWKLGGKSLWVLALVVVPALLLWTRCGWSLGAQQRRRQAALASPARSDARSPAPPPVGDA